MNWVGRSLKGIAFGIAILIMVVVIRQLVVSRVGGSQIEMEIQALRSRGEPTTPAELVGRPVPVSMDAAPAYGKFNSSARRADADLQAVDKLLGAKGGWTNRRSMAQANRLLDKHPDMFARLRTATSKPKCQMISMGDNGMVRFSPCSELSEASSVLRVKARLDASEGKTDAAIASVVQGFKVSEAMNDAPAVFIQVERSSCLRMASDSLGDVVDFCPMTEDQARRLYDFISGLDMDHGYLRAIQGERVQFFSMLSLMHRSSSRMILARALAFARGGFAHRPSFGGVRREPFASGDEVLYLRSLQKYADSVQLSYQQMMSQGLLTRPPGVSGGFMIDSVIAQQVRANNARFAAKAELSGDLALLAIVAHKDRFGTYPANLGELRAKLGWKIPEDPFNGKDFLYKRKGKGFVLYSIGRNLRDDGGQIPQRDDEDSGDIVWRMDH